MDKKSILITGAEGMLGKACFEYFEKKYGDSHIIHRIDKSKNLDMTDIEHLERWFLRWQPDYIINLASLSDVAESIILPRTIIQNNILLTLNLFDCVRRFTPKCRVLQFSTDEVFDDEGRTSFTEEDPIRPRNPYSASKHAQEDIAFAYANTYGLDVVVTNCTNIIGSHQGDIVHIGGGKKLLPALIDCAMNGTLFRLDDEGKATRTWVNVNDVCSAIDVILFRGTQRRYNIGGKEVLSVMEVLKLVEKVTGKKIRYENTKRAGQDFHYNLDTTRLQNELNWYPKWTVEKTIKYLVDNKNW